MGDLWIEHILPDTISEEWKSYLGERWETIHDNKRHTLGNLTLISPPKNISLSNKLYPDKIKEWYQYSNVEMTKEIKQKWERWTEDEIIERTASLVKRALKIWPKPKDNHVEVLENGVLEDTWKDEQLIEYLKGSNYNQLLFLSVLADTLDNKVFIPYDFILLRMSELAKLLPDVPNDKKYSGSTIGGLRAGFKLRRKKYFTEDIILTDNYRYKLKKQYRKIVKEWIKSEWPMIAQESSYIG